MIQRLVPRREVSVNISKDKAEFADAARMVSVDEQEPVVAVPVWLPTYLMMNDHEPVEIEL